jgi:hypothetical protein
MFEINSNNLDIVEQKGKNCYLSCPLCRNDSKPTINNRPIYNLDSMALVMPFGEIMWYIHNLYHSDDENIPYIFICYPDGYSFIVDPITRYIYDVYGKKYRIGTIHFKKTENGRLQSWLTFHYKIYCYLYDFFCCGSKRIKIHS